MPPSTVRTVVYGQHVSQYGENRVYTGLYVSLVLLGRYTSLYTLPYTP